MCWLLQQVLGCLANCCDQLSSWLNTLFVLQLTNPFDLWIKDALWCLIVQTDLYFDDAGLLINSCPDKTTLRSNETAQVNVFCLKFLGNVTWLVSWVIDFLEITLFLHRCGKHMQCGLWEMGWRRQSWLQYLIAFGFFSNHVNGVRVTVYLFSFFFFW